jgi:hypothetical protein
VRITTVAALVCFGALFLPSLARAESLDAAVKRDFPGWSVNRSAEGDLDGDKAVDVAAILDRRPAGADATKEALLVVYRSDEKHALQLLSKSPKGICVGCGGPKAIMGEPLGELEIAKGILTITYEGGSREMWSDVFKWRWDATKKDFLLIGETYSSTDTIGEEPDETYDINVSTLKVEATTGKKKRNCTAPVSMKSQTLSAFDYDSHDLTEVIKRCK